ncbi:MAG: hypothetical protein GXP25_08755 [Planctomycetes bacterium]|nr:hypothetical protein [Planctomycetota bacterium]
MRTNPNGQYPRLVSAAALALTTALGCVVFGGDASLPKPSKALRVIQQRYFDLVRYRNVQWDDPEVAKLVARIEYDTGRLLQEQVTDPGSPWHGFFGMSKGKPLGGQSLLAARAKAEKAIHTLSSVFWCKPSRFHQSKRVLRCIEMAYNALPRRQSIHASKSIYDIAPPYRYRTANLCRWLAQVGEFLSKDVRVHMKDTLRHLLVRQKMTDPTRGMKLLLGAVCLEDDRLLSAAGRDMKELLGKWGDAMTPDGDIAVEAAAAYCAAVSGDHYFTRDTDFAPRAKSIRAAGDLLHDFILWTVYRGRADLLAYRNPRQWSGQVERDIASTVAYLTAAGPNTRETWRFAYDSVIRCAFGHRERLCDLLTLRPLTSRVASVPEYAVEPRTKYFPEKRYLAVQRPSFFASLRFPSRARAALDYSQLDVATNVRSTPNDPNLLFLMPEFEPLLPGGTFSQYIAEKKKAVYDSRKCSETTCPDAAVLDDQTAIAGVRLRIKRKDNFLTANKSWVFFEDKMVFAGSGIETKSYDIRNLGWAAKPTDHRASITFAFQKSVQIDFARIFFRVYRGRLYCVPRTMYFMVSGDGSAWTRVREVKREDLPRSGDVPLGGLTYHLRPSKAPFYRLYFPADADGFTTQIAEVEFYKTGAKQDTDPIPPGAKNLALEARVSVSSTFGKDLGPERITDGNWAPALEPSQVQTCLSILRTRAARFTYRNPRGVRWMAFPALGKKSRLRDVSWCHIKQTAYIFLQPADLILTGIGNGYGRISIDHERNDRFAVVCFPNLDLEQTPRAAEAGLVTLTRLDKSAHILVDQASGTTAAAFFDIVKDGAITSEGPAYLLVRQHPDLLIAAKSRREAPSTLWIDAPKTKTLVVNGKVQPVYKNGNLVRVTAHR